MGDELVKNGLLLFASAFVALPRRGGVTPDRSAAALADGNTVEHALPDRAAIRLVTAEYAKYGKQHTSASNRTSRVTQNIPKPPYCNAIWLRRTGNENHGALPLAR